MLSRLPHYCPLPQEHDLGDSRQSDTPERLQWNKLEHRLFSYLSTNWRGQLLGSLAVIVNSIGSTRTTAGLRVRCELDRGTYPKGDNVPDAKLAMLTLVPHRFHGHWNYTINPMRWRR
jgi:hypothetical protein